MRKPERCTTIALLAVLAAAPAVLRAGAAPGNEQVAETPVVEAQTDPAEPPPPDPETEAEARAELRHEIQGHESRIKEIEVRDGVYAGALAEELYSLALAYREEGRYEQAVDALQRLLHIMRVNQGLYTLKQLDILDLLIELDGKLKQWEDVADAYDLELWVHRRNFKPNDPALLPVLKRLRSWHINAYSLDTGRSLTEHFYTAQRLYRQAIDIIVEQTGDRQAALCFWHRECCSKDNPDDAAVCERKVRIYAGTPVP